MSILERALRKCGTKLEGDVLPPDQRTQRVFKRVIAAIRAAEAETVDRLSDSERELNKALQQIVALRNENEELRARLLAGRLKESLEQIPALTVSDKNKLLECAGAA